MRWDRRAVLRYTHLRVGKGDVGEWRRVIWAEGTLCRLCGVEEESGTHLVLGCEESYGLRLWAWVSWEVQEYGILPHSRTYYCLLFSLYHMFIVFVISY